MNEVNISVRGEHQVEVPAELGIVYLAVSTSGPERPAVVERAVALSDPLRADLSARKQAGQLQEWVSQQVEIRSERPWNDGRYLAPVHYATINFTVTFHDAGELSMWVSEIAERDGIQVGHIAWELSAQTKQRVERETATAAVKVAVERATAYANAIGKKEITPLQIADVGLLSNTQVQPRAMFAQGKMAMASDAGQASLDLHPQDIIISAAVEARFAAH